MQGSKLGIKKTLVLSSILALPVTVNASRWGLDLYTGFEYGQRKMEMPRNLGRHILPKRLPQYNLYLGTKINCNLSVEGNLLFTESVSRVALSKPADYALGIGIDAGDFMVSRSKNKIQGYGLGIVGYLPLNHTLSLMASAGFNVLKLHYHYSIIATDAGFTADTDLNTLSRVFNSTKMIPKMAIGVEGKLNDKFSLRATLGYELTHRFKNITPNDNAVRANRITLHNTYTAGLNLIFKF